MSFIFWIVTHCLFVNEDLISITSKLTQSRTVTAMGPESYPGENGMATLQNGAAQAAAQGLSVSVVAEDGELNSSSRYVAHYDTSSPSPPYAFRKHADQLEN